MTSSPNTADTMDARVEALYEHVRGLGFHGPDAKPWAERSPEHQAKWRAALAASDAVAQAPQNGWVGWYDGPGEWFWCADKPPEHELVDDVRPATALEKAFFEWHQPKLSDHGFRSFGPETVAQAPQQPVAWRYELRTHYIVKKDGTKDWQWSTFYYARQPLETDGDPGIRNITPLYTSPPREEDVQPSGTYRSGQWRAFSTVLEYINTLEERLVEKKKIYAAVMEMRPTTEEDVQRLVARVAELEAACEAAQKSISRFPGSLHDRAMEKIEKALHGRNSVYEDRPEAAIAESIATARE